MEIYISIMTEKSLEESQKRVREEENGMRQTKQRLEEVCTFLNVEFFFFASFSDARHVILLSAYILDTFYTRLDLHFWRFEDFVKIDLCFTGV